MLVGTVNFPFVVTQNFSLRACRFRRPRPAVVGKSPQRERGTDVRMGNQDVVEALSRRGRFEDGALAAVRGEPSHNPQLGDHGTARPGPVGRRASVLAASPGALEQRRRFLCGSGRPAVIVAAAGLPARAIGVAAPVERVEDAYPLAASAVDQIDAGQVRARNTQMQRREVPERRRQPRRPPEALRIAAGGAEERGGDRPVAVTGLRQPAARIGLRWPQCDPPDVTGPAGAPAQSTQPPIPVRYAAAPRLERARQRRCQPGAHLRAQPPPQARRGRGEPRLDLQPARRRIPNGRAREGMSQGIDCSEVAIPSVIGIPGRAVFPKLRSSRISLLQLVGSVSAASSGRDRRQDQSLQRSPSLLRGGRSVLVNRVVLDVHIAPLGFPAGCCNI